MKQHLQDEIKKKLGDVVNIEQSLNLSKMHNGEAGSGGYYHKMQQWYLDDMEVMLGSPCDFTYEEDEIHLRIEGREAIDCIYLCFDRWTGKYLGLYMIITKRRQNGAAKLSPKVMKSIRTKEVNQMILQFVGAANNLCYLV